LKFSDLTWQQPPADALIGLPLGSLVLWKHDGGVELAELATNEWPIEVDCFGFAFTLYAAEFKTGRRKRVRNTAHDAVHILD
jgi:hypothetical protein